MKLPLGTAAMLAATLTLVAGSADAAKLTTLPSWQTTGAIKLKASDVKRVEKLKQKGSFVQCGLVPSKRFPAGRWVAGTVVSSGASKGLFLPLFVESANLKTKSFALKKLGNASQAKVLLTLSNNKKSASLKGNNTCNVLNATAPQNSSSGTAAGTSQARLTFDLRNAVALVSNAASSRRRSMSTRQGLSSSLAAIRSDGTVRDAVASGSLSVSSVVPGPNNKVYISGSTSAATESPNGSTTIVCYLIEVDLSTNAATCVDQESQVATWTAWNYGNPFMQFDSQGRLIYRTSSGALKRYGSGQVATLTNSIISVWDFAVLPNDSIAISGRTTSNDTKWVRVLKTNGSLQTVGSTDAVNLLSVFSDGNLYVGLWGGTEYGIRRYLTATQAVDPTWWTSGSSDSLPTSHGTLPPCIQGWAGGYVRNILRMDNGDVYTLPWDGITIRLAKYFPTISCPTYTPITKISSAVSTGDKIVLAGLNSLNVNRLLLYDPASDSTLPLDVGLDEIEVYNLSFSSSGNKVYFDGLRLSDNQYVLGEIDLTTYTSQVLSTTPNKVSEVVGL